MLGYVVGGVALVAALAILFGFLDGLHAMRLAAFGVALLAIGIALLKSRTRERPRARVELLVRTERSRAGTGRVGPEVSLPNSFIRGIREVPVRLHPW